MTLTEASASVKNPHALCCAIANGPLRHAIAEVSALALLGRARVPLGVGVVRLAEPLPAAYAILLRAAVAGFIHA